MHKELLPNHQVSLFFHLSLFSFFFSFSFKSFFFLSFFSFFDVIQKNQVGTTAERLVLHTSPTQVMVTHEEGGGKADKGDGVYGVNDDNFLGGISQSVIINCISTKFLF